MDSWQYAHHEPSNFASFVYPQVPQQRRIEEFEKKTFATDIIVFDHRYSNEEESYFVHSKHNTDKNDSYVGRESKSKTKNLEQPKPYERNTVMRAPKNSDEISQRLDCLEAMLEQLVKREAEALRRAEEEKEIMFYPDNYKFTTSMWIEKITEIGAKINNDEKFMFKLMERTMTGALKAWYMTLPKIVCFFRQWARILLIFFPDNTDFASTLQRMVTRVKTAKETMKTYYYTKMYLIEGCKISGQDAVNCVIDGLNNKVIQEEAKRQNFLSPETLYEQYLKNLPKYEIDYTPTFELSKTKKLGQQAQKLLNFLIEEDE